MTTTCNYTEHDAAKIMVRMGTFCNDKDIAWMADKLKVRTRIDEETKRMMIEISTYFHAIEKQRIQHHYKWPVDWWQAMRARWLPAWWLKRRPVHYMNLDIDEPRYGPVCPHLYVPKDTKHDIEHRWQAENNHLKWIARREKCPNCDQQLW